ncbi:MAG TPA: Holliday junction resolvase RuvX [Myxococcales bacterium]
MRIMGLDVGSKTVGVAISDELHLIAQALMTIRRSTHASTLAKLRGLAEEHEVERIVVGLPLHMNGTEGPEAGNAREFGQSVAAALGQPVEFWDERLSTVAAERVLLEGNVSRQKRRQVIDHLAAAIILQGWLDAHQREP